MSSTKLNINEYEIVSYIVGSRFHGTEGLHAENIVEKGMS